MIGQNLPELATQFPDKIAIKTEDHEVTYAAFYENTKKLQYHMRKIVGTEKSKKVAIFIGNTPSFLEVFFATVTLGWIGIPMDPKWSDTELETILAELQPDLAVFQKRPKEHASFPCLAYEQVIHSLEKSETPWDVDNDQDFYIGYTSGSSGRQKGYIRNHRSWLESFAAAEKAFSMTKEDYFFSPGPFCHSLSLFAAVHALHLGASVYISEFFDAEKATAALQSEAITIIYAVPTMLYAISNEFNKRNIKNEHLQKIIISGSKWEAQQKDQIKSYFPNAERLEFYGASELSFITYVDEKGFKENPKSIGIPFPGVDIRIADGKGLFLPTGKVGQVFVKSDLVFSGYINQPEATEEMFFDDYATVGDMGFFDKNGYLTLVGRKKNMIISGGLNIFPEEVEGVIRRHPSIEEVVVLGIPDEYWGEKLTAYIQWVKDEEDNALQQHCLRELPAYKCPKEYITVEHFPMTASGKIARKDFQRLVEKRQVVVS